MSTTDLSEHLDGKDILQVLHSRDLLGPKLFEGLVSWPPPFWKCSERSVTGRRHSMHFDTV